MKNIYILFISLIALTGCSSADNAITPTSSLYFPPIGSDVWATKSLLELGWNENQVQPLLDYLELKNTKSFIILVDVKIVMENYFNGHTAAANWYWASAGKTLSATMVGIADQEGFLDLDAKASTYLGTAWTSMPLEKENLITGKHLLTMTSGIEDIENGDCVTADCLTYTADAGTRWAYHNVFVKLQDMVESATGQNYFDYFDAKLKDKIGMNGLWFTSESNIVYASNARSMARFGLLMLGKGKWDNEVILNQNYFMTATQTSQNINQAYGYLWWLNGKPTYHLPQSQFEFTGNLISSGPSDMFMALGKNDQKIYVVPSKNMVVIRMGDAADSANFALSEFDNVLWQKINALYE